MSFPVHPRSRKERIERAKEDAPAEKQFKTRDQLQQQKRSRSQFEREIGEEAGEEEPLAPPGPRSSFSMDSSSQQQEMAGHLRGVLEHLSEGIGIYNRVVVKDLEIEMDNSVPEMQHDDGMLPDDGEEYDGDDISPLMGLDISKIKVGRIEFYNDREGDSEDGV